MVEGSFAKMTHQMLKGTRVESEAKLARRIYLWFVEVNRVPVVHRWRYRMDETGTSEKPKIAGPAPQRSGCWAALISYKVSFRPAALARRPSTTRARRGVRTPRPSSCPLVHTGHSTVCKNGQERRDTANLVSDFAHAWASRVHKRTRDRPNRPPRVRACD